MHKLFCLLVAFLVATTPVFATGAGGGMGPAAGNMNVLPDSGTDVTKFLGTNGAHGWAMGTPAGGLTSLNLTTNAAQTSNFNAVINNIYTVDNTSGNVTATLPDATLAANKGGLIVISWTAGSNSLLLATTSAQTINGQAPGAFTGVGTPTTFFLHSDGSNWQCSSGANYTSTGVLIALGGAPQTQSTLTFNSPVLTVGSSGAGGQVAVKGATSGTATITTPAVAATPTFQLPASGAGTTQQLVPVGGNGSDGALSWTGNQTAARVWNATTLTLTGTATCPNCVINTTGVIAFAGNVLRADAAGSGQTIFGGAAAGGYGATAATSIGTAGYGTAGGQGGNNAATIGPGGGAGAAGAGGNGGGATIASGAGEGGLNGAGATAYSGSLNGSGGGGGGSGSGGTGGNGGAGGSHIIIITAATPTASGGMTVAAQSATGSAGGTLGSGGGGGGGGTVEFFGAGGNLPSCTFTVSGANGGASAGASGNSGGGGGGYIYVANAGTTASATLTVSGGSAGGSGSGASGTAGSAGLGTAVSSLQPTLPHIVFNHLDGNSANKNMCWILLARKAIRGEDYESEKSHIFVWDGEKNEHVAPLSYVAATYAKPGAFGELYTALRFGGDDSTANLCDATKVDAARKTFDEFKDSVIRGEMPLIESTCDDTELLRPTV